MEKIYKVFVSSTYTDLQEARKEVLQALLDLNCIPVAMEGFPASNEEPWEFIKKVIEECDYYVLILGGRYGSCDKDGIGFIEKEYDYAIEKGIPIIAFPHKNPEKLSRENSCKNDEEEEKYKLFREKITKLFRQWNTPEELRSQIYPSIIRLIKDHPRTGWVKADKISSEDSLAQILKLKNAIEELRKHQNTAPENIEDLAQGEDLFTINYKLSKYDEFEEETRIYAQKYSMSWNKIFSIISPFLICSNHVNNLSAPIENIIQNNVGNNSTISLNENDFNTILIQFNALGLIEPKNDLWKLTSYGKNYMMKIKTVKKEPAGQIATSG
ncbi:MAG: hypothetical protein A2Y25_00995 [Candidatus Melainabacteria bacterium GWF2_37_15]|nr:MAG: hypothetical protein A2Y25_00995 [Candidatus Melainabacteria bacterium GWF2_37_15]